MLTARLGQNISKTLPSLQWSESIKSGPKKNSGEPATGLWVAKDSLMHMGSDGWPDLMDNEGTWPGLMNHI